MATRGRKPTPEHLKILKGTRADRLNPDAPEGVKGRPERPDHLDEVAADEWDRMVAHLDAMGILTQTDGAALAMYCVAFSRWLDARDEIKSKGLVIETDMGVIKPNPAATIALQAEAQMTRLLAEFGCTPSSRGRLKVGGERPKSKLGEFLNKTRKA